MVNIKKNLTKIIAVFAIIFMVIFAGCTRGEPRDNEVVACTMDAKMCPDGSYVGRTGKNCEFVCPAGNGSTADLKKFASSDEIKEYLKTRTQNSDSFGSTLTKGLGSMEAISARSEAAVSYDSSSGNGASASDYSTTNIQVEGVDEADIIKNDGKYIYGITGNKLYIMEAFPAEDAKIIYETKIEGYYGQEIFVSGDKLVLLTNSYKEVQTISKYDFMPRPTNTEITKVVIYDITNRDKPVVLETYELSGGYYDSRMIGDFVYVISNNYVYYSDAIPMPFVKSSIMKISPEVYYFDSIETSYNFNTIASINLKDLEKGINAKSFMLGNGNTLYVSQENIYIAYQNYNQWFGGWRGYGYNYEEEQKAKFFEVVVPLLDSKTQDKIENLGNDAKWEDISSVLEDMYNNMSEDEKKSLVKKIESAVEEYDAKKEEERSKTIIHKISINDGEIEYVNKGEVRGYLLNQFSLDEYNSSLRVATTFNAWTSEKSVIYNNVYVLDENMNTIGTLEKIAPEERIYSTRFMGDKLFMVTFKQVDPLFVIDLSDKTKPEILGYLKIPGFSEYLQMYDETHLIGIGKDTYTEKEITRTKGVKISMFDISDFENPKEVDSVTIGDEGSYSEAQNDHKALLLSKSKNLLVLPVTEVIGKYEYDKNGYYTNKVWQGAYVFSLSETGFEEKGKISHDEEKEDTTNYYYPDYNFNIKRSLFMDDILYTISTKKVMINDLETLDEIKEVKLPYEEPVYDTPIYYAKGTEGVSSSSAGVAVAEPVTLE